MEKSEERKQNNREEDEKRHPDSENNAPSKEKEWDPNRDPNEDVVKDEEKLKALKDVRTPKDADKE